MPPRMRITRHTFTEPRKVLNRLVERASLSVTPVRMLLDGREVDVLCEMIEDDDGELAEMKPLAIVVDEGTAARLAEIPDDDGEEG